MKRVLCAVAVLAPALAAACPVCARDDVPNAAVMVGAMIAAPYLVAAVVVRAIRGGGADR
jgi:hypothetical protein